MNFTQEQISEILEELASQKDGYNQVLKLSLESIMKAEQKLFQKEEEVYANGYRSRRILGMGKELLLSVPRTRSGGFYPFLLSIIRQENEEQNRLISSLYTKGLTTEDISGIWEELYGKTYSTSQISYLMRESKENVIIWLSRDLDSHYLVIYIDATYVSVRRENSVSKEPFYCVLGIKEDGTREVLSIVNYPSEGAVNWEDELINLQLRGVKSVGLVVSDGLSGIENVSSKVFPRAAHQLCVFHAKKMILKTFPKALKEEVTEDLKEVFPVETEEVSQVDGFEKMKIFVDKWEKKYPSLKKYKSQRMIYYYTYLNYPKSIQRMIYTTNWIERLNRDFKKVLKMRGALPNADAVLFLMGSVALEKTETSYRYSIYQFKEVEKLKSSLISSE